MADWKMIDADGHIREVESDVFEYCRIITKRGARRCFIFRCCRIMAGIAKPVERASARSFLIPTLQDWQQALDQGNSKRGGLSDALHAYRPGRHDGFRRRFKQSVQRLSARSISAP